jgi:ureidoglycolate lyase
LSTLVNITAQPLTEEAFNPFGTLLTPGSEPPDFQGVSSVGWKTPFEVDDAPLLMLLVSRFSGLRFSRLERHFMVTQAFIPLGSNPALLAVAAPTESAVIPKPEDVRAFLIDGSCGYVLKRGTWHSLDRYPLQETETKIVIITSYATQMELETQSSAARRLTQEVDYEELYGVTFQLML